jgi:hypothetical protein
MTEMGQIKKKKAIFDNPRMSKRGLGQGRDDPLTGVFYDGLRRLNKQVKPVFSVREIPYSIRKVQPPFSPPAIHPVSVAHEMSAL